MIEILVRHFTIHSSGQVNGYILVPFINKNVNRTSTRKDSIYDKNAITINKYSIVTHAKINEYLNKGWRRT